MSVHHAARAAGRVAVAGVAALTVVLTLAAPASAHAEVEADTAQALAENVTLTFVSEAESDTAGFTRVRVVLPDGIAPGDITLADGPEGWRLKTTADGYTVAGPALETGVDAAHKIKVRRLPHAEQLVFKTVETYSDGEIARWIELPTEGAEPEQPAPVLKLKAAVSDSASSGTGPSTRATAGPAPARSTPAEEAPHAQTAEKAAAGQEDGSSTGLLAGCVIALTAVLGGGAWWLARRRISPGTG
ncbi:DUF1775 domain-containing protein [Streptomyces sp. NPDC057424]|uniref:DUF1775 domain-containing protein n=1 Tax=Streptomyces sp. NPDC057424 TaxID=3346127 RepID=UPI003677C6F6